jgi:hypothetical protein
MTKYINIGRTKEFADSEFGGSKARDALEVKGIALFFFEDVVQTGDATASAKD